MFPAERVKGFLVDEIGNITDAMNILVQKTKVNNFIHHEFHS